MRRCRIAIAAAALLAAAVLASTSTAAPSQRTADRQGLALLVRQLPLAYEAADRTHDAAGAGQIRLVTRIAQGDPSSKEEPMFRRMRVIAVLAVVGSGVVGVGLAMASASTSATGWTRSTGGFPNGAAAASASAASAFEVVTW